MPEYAWPVANPVITDGFHSTRTIDGVTFQHGGTDMVSSDLRILVVKGGVVIAEGWNSQMGWYVVVRSADGVQIRYMHFRERSAVRIGQSIIQGQFIGWMGETGFASGVHLHIDASCATNAQSIAELMSFGVPAATAQWSVTWRLNQSFFNLALVFGKVLPEEVDMVNAYKTPNTGNVYTFTGGSNEHAPNPTLLGRMGKVVVHTLPVTDQQWDLPVFYPKGLPPQMRAGGKDLARSGAAASQYVQPHGCPEVYHLIGSFLVWVTSEQYVELGNPAIEKLSIKSAIWNNPVWYKYLPPDMKK